MLLIDLSRHAGDLWCCDMNISYNYPNINLPTRYGFLQPRPILIKKKLYTHIFVSKRSSSPVVAAHLRLTFVASVPIAFSLILNLSYNCVFFLWKCKKKRPNWQHQILLLYTSLPGWSMSTKIRTSYYRLFYWLEYKRSLIYCSSLPNVSCRRLQWLIPDWAFSSGKLSSSNQFWKIWSLTLVYPLTFHFWEQVLNGKCCWREIYVFWCWIM